ncbi:helix-turn-helix domain-containing protein [Saccharopolyspora indica]|uniref:helix-turn-helix domain-containing protein n=1 Tax=Saccharopolyspora indica TaxID=1229659 RepID=UPI0022EA74A3|nr:helix-turn-helix domain-containing protein [Saccharopolyspora indica]MDA3644340.1 helix-turn-helix domain-containing protein [Saccharopolyspora indica]
MPEPLTTAERDSIAALLESVEPISAIARRVGRHPDTVSAILRSRPATQAVRAVALRNRTIGIVSLLIHGASIRAAARAHAVSATHLRWLLAPVRQCLTELQATTHWDGDTEPLLAIRCPHTEDVTRRFQRGRSTVRDVIAAAEHAEHHRLDDLLHAIDLARAGPRPRPRIRAFSVEERARIRYLRDIEQLMWKDVARHFPDRTWGTLAARYHRDKTGWTSPAPAGTGAGAARGGNR